MQHFGDPAKQPLDQDDLVSRVSDLEHLANQITPMLDMPTKPKEFALLVHRYQLTGVEVKRLLIYAEEILEPAALSAFKHRLNREIKPVALNRFEKYRNTNYESEGGI